MWVSNQTVRIRRQRDRPGGQKGLTSPAEAAVMVMLGNNSMAQVYRDRIDVGIIGGLRLCI